MYIQQLHNHYVGGEHKNLMIQKNPQWWWLNTFQNLGLGW